MLLSACLSVYGLIPAIRRFIDFFASFYTQKLLNKHDIRENLRMGTVMIY
jgi:hypothetical protein